MNCTEPKDIISRWLHAAEDAGTSMDIFFGRGNSNTQQISWQRMSHLHYDGLGAFAEILCQDNQTSIAMPLGRSSPRGLSAQACNPVKTMATATKNCGPQPQDPAAITWKYFDPATSQQLQAYARENACTVNSLLLHSLNQSVLNCSDFGAEFQWLVPVNLRGRLSPRRPTSNQVSYLYQPLHKTETLAATHANVTTQLQRGEDWSHYLRMQRFSCLPRFLKKWILARQQKNEILPTGTFSNLGQWDAETALHRKYFWLFCPPLAAHHHLAAGSLCFQNQISLTLHIAATSPLAKEKTSQWMADWSQALIKQIA